MGRMHGPLALGLVILMITVGTTFSACVSVPTRPGFPLPTTGGGNICAGVNATGFTHAGAAERLDVLQGAPLR